MIKYISNDQKCTVTDNLARFFHYTYIAVVLRKQTNLIKYNSLKASGLASVKLEYNEFEAQLQELEAGNQCNRPQFILLHCIFKKNSASKWRHWIWGQYSHQWTILAAALYLVLSTES